MPLTEEDKAFITERGIEVARQLLAAVNINFNDSLRSLKDQTTDLRKLLITQIAPRSTISLRTDHPVAIHSNDHLHPLGTKHDNTRHPRFCRAIEAYFGRRIAALDLGCSGGGLVFDFLIRGHVAVGLEGSDYSFLSQRAEWPVIGEWLHTCDITKPFDLLENSSKDKQKFEVITMWEVLEHISEEELPQLFSNVTSHLASNGIFVGSVALHECIAEGIRYHATIRPEHWWREKFIANGLEMVPPTMFDFHDFCRGSGGSPGEVDFSKNPETGFHFVARKS